MFASGDVVGDYEIQTHLGIGGMATVYLARHRRLGSMHALKLLTASTEAVRERMFQEGRAMARLSHPNIVRSFDLFEHRGAPILVLEYVPGGTLAQHVARVGPLPVVDVVRVALALSKGLRAAHEQGMIHRDLKPENVLMDYRSGQAEPRITDFGLIRGLASAGLTQTGMSMGTPGYTAPEQIRDARRVDGRADLYSLGAVIYFMLAGRGPFAAGTSVQVLLAACKGEHVPLAVRRSDVPRSLAELVDRLLSVKPEDRPATVHDVLSWLERPEVRIRQIGMDPSTARSVAANLGSAPPFAEPSVQEPSIPVAVGLMVPLAAAVVAPALTAATPTRGPAPQLQVEVTTAPEPAPVPREVEPEPEPVVEAAPPPRPADPAPPPPRPAPPARPAVQPVAAPVGAPAPAPAASWARVEAAGEARVVWLVRPGERLKLPAAIPPGSWDVVALFADTEPVTAGRVQVADAPLTVQCNAFTMSCR